jgi:hypothetical protein
VPLIFTASSDKMAKIWTIGKDDRVEPMGVLKQGYMMKEDYMWRFPLQGYDKDLGKRQQDVQHMLDDLRI